MSKVIRVDDNDYKKLDDLRLSPEIYRDYPNNTPKRPSFKAAIKYLLSKHGNISKTKKNSL